MAKRIRRVRRIWPIMLTENEIADACYLAGGRLGKVRRAIENGELQGYRAHGGARWLYFTDEVVTWIRNNFQKRI